MNQQQSKSPSSSKQDQRHRRIQFLNEQLKLNLPPYQAFISTREQVGLEVDDTQEFRLSLIKEIELHTKRKLIVYESHLSKDSQFGANILNNDDKIAFCLLLII